MRTHALPLRETKERDGIGLLYDGAIASAIVALKLSLLGKD